MQILYLHINGKLVQTYFALFSALHQKRHLCEGIGVASTSKNTETHWYLICYLTTEVMFSKLASALNELKSYKRFLIKTPKMLFPPVRPDQFVAF